MKQTLSTKSSGELTTADQLSKKAANRDIIDWHETWKDTMSRCNLFALDKEGHPKQWTAAEAERFIKKANPQYTLFLLNQLNITASDNVLELGCGPGTLTIPVAKKVKQVTAVDSSAGMFEVLKESAEAEGLQNIVYVNKIWREVDLQSDLSAPFDVAFASNAINLMGLKELQDGKGAPVLDWDLEDAVLRLNSVAERVYLTMPLMRHNVPEAFKVVGHPCYSFPSYIMVYNVLSQLGLDVAIQYFVVHEQVNHESTRMLERIEWILNLDHDEVLKFKDKILGSLDDSEKGLQVWALMWWKN
jgi:SAM-dependent methyltransferase